MQAKTPKTSNATKVLLARLQQARTRVGARSILLSEQRERVIRELLERHFYKTRVRLLFELANLHDAEIGRFRRRWTKRFGREFDSDSTLLALRDELRQLWNRDVPLIAKQRIVERWQQWQPGLRGLGYRPWLVWLRAGRLVPFPGSLHAQLVQGVLEQYRYFSVCHNPQCPRRYFLAKRKDQKYCERGDCTAYAQSQYALKWWEKEGKKRRAKKRKRQAKRRRKKFRKRRRRR